MIKTPFLKWKISYGTIIPLRAPRVKKIFYFCAKARQKAFFRAGFFAAARNAKGGYPPRPNAASIALIITGIACEFLRPEESFIRTKPSRRAIFGQIQGFSGTFGIVFILLACYNLVTVTQNAGAATSAAALVVAAICAMACAHCLAEVVSYSGNRVVYYTDGRIFAPFAAALGVQFCLFLFEKFRPAKNKEINYDNAETLD